MLDENENTLAENLEDVLDDLASGSLTPSEAMEQPVTEATEPVIAAKEPFIFANREANVVLAPSRADDALNEGRVNIGGPVSIPIPDKKTQLAGFHCEHAGILTSQYPQYKYKEVKGQPAA